MWKNFYFKRETRMVEWLKLRILYEKGKITNIPNADILINYPPNIEKPQPTKAQIEYEILKENFFKKFPRVTDGQSVVDFIYRQRQFMKRGYSEEKAFAAVQNELKEPLYREMKNSQILSEAGISHRVRSFMDDFQQTAHYEGFLKIKQIERDLPKYQRSTDELKQFTSNQKIDQLEKQSLTYDINTKEMGFKDQRERFIRLYKQLMDYNNEKIYAKDGLQGLIDKDLVWRGREGGWILNSLAQRILQLLRDYKVTIDPFKNIDTGALEEPMASKIKFDPLVKFLLTEFKTTSIESVIEQGQQVTEDEQEVYENGLGAPILWNTTNPYKKNYNDLKSDQIETDSQRMGRLKNLWQELQWKQQDPNEQFEYQQKAVDQMRTLSRKIDQNLMKQGLKPIFEQHIGNEEALKIDQDVDFNRVQEYLYARYSDVLSNEQDKDTFKKVKELITPKFGGTRTVNPYYNENFSVNQLQLNDEVDITEFQQQDKLPDNLDQSELQLDEKEFSLVDDLIITEAEEKEEEKPQSKYEKSLFSHKGRRKFYSQKESKGPKTKLQEALVSIGKSARKD